MKFPFLAALSFLIYSHNSHAGVSEFLNNFFSKDVEIQCDMNIPKYSKVRVLKKEEFRTTQDYFELRELDPKKIDYKRIIENHDNINYRSASHWVVEQSGIANQPEAYGTGIEDCKSEIKYDHVRKTMFRSPGHPDKEALYIPVTATCTKVIYEEKNQAEIDEAKCMIASTCLDKVKKSSEMDAYQKFREVHCKNHDVVKSSRYDVNDSNKDKINQSAPVNTATGGDKAIAK